MFENGAESVIQTKQSKIFSHGEYFAIEGKANYLKTSPNGVDAIIQGTVKKSTFADKK